MKKKKNYYSYMGRYKVILRNVTNHTTVLQYYLWIRDFSLIFLKKSQHLSSVTKSNPIPCPMCSCPITFFARSISTQLISLGQLENWLMCVKAGRPGKRLQPKHESQFVKQHKDSLTVGPERGSATNSMGYGIGIVTQKKW